MTQRIYKAGAFLIIESVHNDTVIELNSSNVQIRKEKTNVDLYDILNENGLSVLKVNLSDIVDANGDAYTENDWNTFRFEQVGAQNTTDVSAVKPKVYKALLTQTGTAAPTAIVLENTLGDIVWSYTGVGSYMGTLSNGFVADKTVFLTGQNYGNLGNEITYMYFDTENTVTVETIDDGSNRNGVLANTAILIEVYP